MKRFLLSAALISLLFSVVIAVVNKPFVTVFAFVLIVIEILLLLLKKQSGLAFLPAVLVVLIMALNCLRIYDVTKSLPKADEVVQIKGTVVSLEKGDDSVAYVLKTDDIDKKSIKTKVKLYSSRGLFYRPGENVTVLARMGESITSVSRYSYGITAVGTVYKEIVKDGKDFVYSTADAIRTRVINTVYSYLSGEDGAILTGLAIGDKSMMSDSLLTNIKGAGVSHVMVVSGMHLSIITSLFMFMLDRLKIGMKSKAVCGIALVLTLCAVTGFTPSAIRSSITFVIMFAAVLFERKADALNSLCAAVCIILAINPYAVFNVSFLLSAGATLGVLVVSPQICDLLFAGKRGIIYTLLGIVIMSLSAIIMTLPVTVWFFGEISALSFVSNVLITYPVMTALIFTVLAVAFSFAPFIYKPFLLAGGFIARYIGFIINTVGSLPFGLITVNNPLAVTVITGIVAVAVTVLCYIKTENTPRRKYFGDTV